MPDPVTVTNISDSTDEDVGPPNAKRKKSAAKSKAKSKNQKKTDPLLAGCSSTSEAMMEELEKRHPATFSRHSLYEVLCLECRYPLSIRRGGTKDASKHVTTIKHSKCKAANKSQTTLNFATKSPASEKFIQDKIKAEIIHIQIMADKNISFVASSEIARYDITIIFID